MSRWTVKSLSLCALIGLSCLAKAAEVNVYSYRQPQLIKPIFDVFTQETGVAVNAVYAKTGMLERLRSEGRNSPADLVFTVDIGRLTDTVNAGLTQAVQSSALTKNIPESFRDPDGHWFGLTSRARIIATSIDRVKAGEISTYEELTDPKWKGRIGWPPTNGSFQAMVTAMRVQWGEDETREWLKGIQANKPAIFPKNTPTVAAAATGEIHVGFVNHYYLHRFMAEEGDSFGARNFFMNGGGPGSIVLVAGAGILETTNNNENAEKFLRFMLSKVAQQYFASQTFEYPLIEGVKTDRMLPPINTLKNPNIDMASLTDLKGTQSMLRELKIIQ